MHLFLLNIYIGVIRHLIFLNFYLIGIKNYVNIYSYYPICFFISDSALILFEIPIIFKLIYLNFLQ